MSDYQILTYDDKGQPQLANADNALEAEDPPSPVA
jgi:hypothetical protein